MSKKQYKIIFISSLVIALFLLFIQIQENISLAKSITAETKKTATGDISISVIVGSTTFNLTSQVGQNLYNMLLLAKEKKQITFSGKNYPALGFFITDINSLHSGNGKNLIYYINNKEASVGISSYLPQNKDVIEWKLK